MKREVVTKLHYPPSTRAGAGQDGAGVEAAVAGGRDRGDTSPCPPPQTSSSTGPRRPPGGGGVCSGTPTGWSGLGAHSNVRAKRVIVWRMMSTGHQSENNIVTTRGKEEESMKIIFLVVVMMT